MNTHKMDLLSNLNINILIETPICTPPKTWIGHLNSTKRISRKDSLLFPFIHSESNTFGWYDPILFWHGSQYPFVMLINTCTTKLDMRLQPTITLLETLMATKEISGCSTLLRDDYWSKPNQQERLYKKGSRTLPLRCLPYHGFVNSWRSSETQ